jgi:CubicO group peptidase (beta-lactamase class C family)
MSLEPRSFASKVVPFVLAAALPLAVQAQSARVEQGVSIARLQRVTEMVDRNIKGGVVTGAVTLVARNGRIVFQQAQGLSDLEKKTPMRNDTVFRIASMSKPVTGVAILMLVEEGRIRLADPISRFLPAFKDLKVSVSRPPAPALAQPVIGAGPPPPQTFLVPAEREVTILDLLTHTSGMMSGPVSNAAGKELTDNRQKTGLKWTEGLTTVPLEFQPGSRWAYSGLAGLDLLAHIVEVVSGENFNEFTSQRIFKPLGMRDTFFWPTAAQRARLVGSYTSTANGLTPRENPDSLSSEIYFSGAGGLMSTAESYARFAMMLANGGELNGVRILSPRSVELMGSAFIPDTLPGRPHGEGYGLSVRVVTDPIARITTLSKGSFGWSGAFGTHFFVDPGKKLTAIMMIQTPVDAMRADFEDAVMQAVVD